MLMIAASLNGLFEEDLRGLRLSCMEPIELEVKSESFTERQHDEIRRKAGLTRRGSAPAITSRLLLLSISSQLHFLPRLNGRGVDYWISLFSRR